MIEDVYPLSPLQEGLYYHWLSAPQSSVYFEQMSYRLAGDLDLVSLEKSYAFLVSRHAVLRTVFTQNFGERTLQVVKRTVTPDFVLVDIIKDKEFSIENYKAADKAKGFDLTKGPLMRLSVIALENKTYEFIWSHHHILMDGWCVGILLKEFFEIYQSLISGKSPELPKIAPYSDYINWLGTRDQVVSLTHWRNYLQGYNTLNSVPRSFNTAQNFIAKELRFSLDEKLRGALKQQCIELGITENTFIQLAWGILLSKYNGSRDVVFGSVVSGRPTEIDGIESMIGLFINTIPVRIRYNEKSIVCELLKDVHKKSIECLNYHYDQLAQIQSECEAGSNLFDHILVFQNYPVSEIIKQGIGELTLIGSDAFEQNNYDFTLAVGADEEMSIRFMFNAAKYDIAFVTRLQKHFCTIIEKIITDPSQRIDDLGYMVATEKMTLLACNNSSVHYPRNETIVSLFEEQVSLTPDYPAVVFGEKELTYKELNEYSNQLANYLTATYALRANALVAVKMERGEWMIIALLGILKTGAGYLPIDMDAPQERVDYILQDSGSITLLDEEKLRNLDFNIHSTGNPVVSIASSDLAYVIYTSGTTGQPKGVQVEHGNVVRLFKTDRPLFDFSSKDVWTMFHSYSFDFSVWEMYGALLFGGKLVIVPKATAQDPSLYIKLLQAHQVTVLNQTPSAFYNLLREEAQGTEDLSSLRYVIFGGEALSPLKLASWRAKYPNVRLINMYGITETTVHVTYKEISDQEIASNISNIGVPIPTLSCYVLDQCQQLVPCGIWGELYVGGAGVARGYLNRPELTSQRFINSPFVEGERLYRSGDKVRLLENGEMEYLGRVDEQVKIRGYRIETGEITTLLEKHDSVASATVIVKENEEGEKELVAYVVPSVSEKGVLNVAALRAYLNKHLPPYMIPGHYVQLDRLPLTTNGKVNKKALPDPKELSLSTGAEYLAPQNTTEEKLARIWEKVLEKKQIGITDNFFEVGGDSIKIIRMIAELRKELKIEISIAEVYKNNTITDLLSFVSKNKEAIELKNTVRKKEEVQVLNELNRLKEIVLFSEFILDKENVEDVYPMSDIEKGMVFESSLNEDSGIYHDQMLYQKTFTDFSMDRFELALELLVEKHAVLRTCFDLYNYETPVQIVRKKIKLPLEYKDISKNESIAQEELIRNFTIRERGKMFNFSQAPLWRINIFGLGENEYVFAFQCHHSIIDGWSNASFITELNNLYLKLEHEPSFQPKKLKSSYKDYIIQNELHKQNVLVKEFWQKELTEYSRLDLFTKEEEVKSFSRYFGEEYLKKIEEASKKLNTSVKTISLSAYLILLKVLNYSDEIVSGLVTNGRPNTEDSDLMLGCFLNTIPLKIFINGNDNGKDFIAEVHKKLLELKEYENLSLADIAIIAGDKTGARNPFFDVTFNYIDFYILDELVQVEEIKKQPNLNLASSVRTNTYLNFTVDNTGGSFNVNVRISKKLKSELSLERVCSLFFDILNFIVDHPIRSLDEMGYLNEQEKSKLLGQFNNTERYYHADKTVLDFFEEQVKLTPENIAVVFEDTKLTYAELNAKANQLAHFIRNKYKIVPDDLIGIKLGRSEYIVITILGVLKSGAAYVPIDPEYALERINYIIDDCKCKLVIDEDELRKIEQEVKRFPEQNPVHAISSSSLLYIIYTSGTTGNPKGVMIQHKNIINYNTWFVDSCKIKEQESTLLLSSFTFDGVKTSLFGALLSGNTLHVISNALVKNGHELANYIHKNKISFIKITPSLLNLMVSDEASFNTFVTSPKLRFLIVGGEEINISDIKLIKEASQKIEIINHYGPTETTVGVVTHTIERATYPIPIGSPIFNAQIYIVNKVLQLLPIGVPGEICIGGAGVAKGYLNKPELTKEKFIDDPFTPGEKIYRSGDIGKWLPDGKIEFIGRKDNQVKIHGYRIELGEIESAIRMNSKVEDVVVILRTTIDNTKELIAYLVCSDGLMVSEIRLFLRKSLPTYMIPNHFVQLDKLPLTPNGKINKKGLPEPELNALSTGIEYVAPTNETEIELTELWNYLLNKQKIGINDNFFELGGHSIKAMVLISKIERSFDVSMKINEVFDNPTVALMSNMIRAKQWIKGGDKSKKELRSITEI